MAIFPFLIAGCVSKKESRFKAREAYVAGQQQAMQQLQRQNNPNIQVNGAVKNSLVPWVEGLTLAQAIAQAVYTERRDPREIFILRKGEAILINPKDLLRGKDEPLQQGDRIEIRP